MKNDGPGGPYEVGYGRPPLPSRFSNGQSGNPGGRPKGKTARRASDLALQEAFRAVSVREGDTITKMPAIQAVLRSQVALAVKGNGPAQRALIDLIQALEREPPVQVAKGNNSGSTTGKMSDLDLARRIAFLLAKPLAKP